MFMMTRPSKRTSVDFHCALVSGYSLHCWRSWSFSTSASTKKLLSRAWLLMQTGNLALIRSEKATTLVYCTRCATKIADPKKLFQEFLSDRRCSHCRRCENNSFRIRVTCARLNRMNRAFLNPPRASRSVARRSRHWLPACRAQSGAIRCSTCSLSTTLHRTPFC